MENQSVDTYCLCRGFCSNTKIISYICIFLPH